MKQLLCLLFLTINFPNTQSFGKGRDTFAVYFDKGDARLNPQACHAIDELIFKDKLIHGQRLIVLGYADYVGDTALNSRLSDTRAKNVQEYLVKMGFSTDEIKLCAGKGEIKRSATEGTAGFAVDRKVEIIIDKEQPKPHPENKAVQNKDMMKAGVNETIRLNNIFFKPGSADILEASYPELSRLHDFLDQNRSVTIRIEGHVCCLGPAQGQDDDDLSEFRAEAVFNYLVSKGIASERMKYAGVGNNNPVVQEEVTEEDRNKNRRVEIRILSK